jgi:hypothetical protein
MHRIMVMTSTAFGKPEQPVAEDDDPLESRALGAARLAVREIDGATQLVVDVDGSIADKVRRDALEDRVRSNGFVMRTIARRAQIWRESEGVERVPTLDELDEPPLDPWGTPYRLSLVGDGVVVECAGPDKQFGTDDDLRNDTDGR